MAYITHDVLVGSAGRDTLCGDNEADAFLFDAPLGELDNGTLTEFATPMATPPAPL